MTTGIGQESDVEEVDVVVIGAGFCGLYATWRFRAMGLRVRSFETAPDVGGVWYWNRYPGAQTDSPGYTYQFTFDDELLRGWKYTRKNPQQREVLGYLNRVADKFDLRSSYHFGSRVVEAHYDDESATWAVRSDHGHRVRARFVVAGLGFVSEPVRPDYPGIDDFQGEVVYTATWPEHVDYAGKRVALIGTGSSGIQIAPYLAKEAAQLTVFQRTPNYAVPSGNYDITDEAYAAILDDYDGVKRRVRHHPSSFPFEVSVGRLAVEATPEERSAIFEEMWNKGGFSFLYEAFDDVPVDPAANELACEFVREKIRTIVKDPATAELLIPTYPYGAKRPPTSEGYYETFNEPNVSLVSVRSTPIVEFTPTGIRTTDAEYEFDLVVFATGFDVGTGPFDRIDIRGREGRVLKEHWATGPSTYLALAVNGFPNLFLVAGPQSPFTNLPPGSELEGGWAADIVEYMRAEGYEVAEPTAAAEAGWNRAVAEVAEGSLMANAASVNSWFTGANIEGKARAWYNYFGGGAAYADLLEAEADARYPSFVFGRSTRELEEREGSETASASR